MYQKITEKLIKLNPQQAQRNLLLNDFESQRPLKPRKVNELADVMRSGLFLVGEIAIAQLAYRDDKRVLMNGQHQCEACIQTNSTVSVVYEEYTCPDLEDASLLFRQFDNSGIRTVSDKVKVEMDSLSLHWPVRVGQLVVAAASHGKNITANQKVELLKHNQRFGEFLYKIIGVSENGGNISMEAAHLRRVPVVYAMQQTFSKSQEASDVFWRQVRDGEGLRRPMPAYKLRNFLLTHNYAFGRGSVGIKVSTFHEMASKCITAWNAFRRETTTDLKYYMERELPKPC